MLLLESKSFSAHAKMPVSRKSVCHPSKTALAGCLQRLMPFFILTIFPSGCAK
jgi:hypothetical protein